VVGQKKQLKEHSEGKLYYLIKTGTELFKKINTTIVDMVEAQNRAIRAGKELTGPDGVIFLSSSSMNNILPVRVMGIRCEERKIDSHPSEGDWCKTSSKTSWRPKKTKANRESGLLAKWDELAFKRIHKIDADDFNYKTQIKSIGGGRQIYSLLPTFYKIANGIIAEVKTPIDKPVSYEPADDMTLIDFITANQMICAYIERRETIKSLRNQSRLVN